MKLNDGCMNTNVNKIKISKKKINKVACSPISLEKVVNRRGERLDCPKYSPIRMYRWTLLPKTSQDRLKVFFFQSKPGWMD